MLRRLWRRQAEIAAEGGDPVGVSFEQPYVIELRAANALVDARTREILQGPDARGL